MAAMGADVEKDGLRVTVRPSELKSIDIQVPSDISGAAFWLVAGAAHPNARVTVKSVGINPSRTGVLDVLREMGANIRMENVREDGNEPSADLVAESSDLRGIEIGGDIIPRVIDELPVLAMAASQASGQTVIRDAAELRVKESDRISATANGLNALGATIREVEDGMIIEGGSRLRGAEVVSHGDHRIAMSMAVAGLVADGETHIGDSEAADVSYPSFWETLEGLRP
jgi:3-phosphoshikimate 1-carboxyvinyltransferase